MGRAARFACAASYRAVLVVKDGQGGAMDGSVSCRRRAVHGRKACRTSRVGVRPRAPDASTSRGALVPTTYITRGALFSKCHAFGQKAELPLQLQDGRLQFQ